MRVIIPAFNAATTLPACLTSVAEILDPAGDEVVVVDDGSTDGTAAVAESLADKVPRLSVIRQERNQGAAAARNRGAEGAAADVLLFIDADCRVCRCSRARLLGHFQAADVVGVQGIYDRDTPAASLVSVYKNLSYHFQYVRMDGSSVDFASTFFFAVTRKAFGAAGGFSQLVPKASVEDSELGYDLVRRVGAIILDKELRVQHLVEYSLRTMLRRSFRNAAEKVRSILRKRGQLGIRHSRTEHPVTKLASIVLGGLSSWCLLAVPLEPRAAVLAAVLLAGFLGTNYPQLAAARRYRSWRFAVAYAALLYADLTTSFYGLGWGVLRR